MCVHFVHFPLDIVAIQIWDMGTDDTAGSDSDSKGPIRKASSATDEEDNLIYDFYYQDRRVIVERGVVVLDFDDSALRVRVVLDAQGWTEMVKDHRPEVEEIMREFYANLHHRCGDFFLIVEVTPTLINNITGAPPVCDPVYPWPVDCLPYRVVIVECFVEGHLH
jgi:hypothetical protein